MLCDWILGNDYILNSGDPTYDSEGETCSHIYITITDNNFATQLNLETAPQPYNSDHYLIIVQLEEIPHVSRKNKRLCLKSANWNEYRESLLLPSEIDSTAA